MTRTGGDWNNLDIRVSAGYLSKTWQPVKKINFYRPAAVIGESDVHGLSGVNWELNPLRLTVFPLALHLVMYSEGIC